MPRMIGMLHLVFVDAILYTKRQACTIPRITL